MDIVVYALLRKFVSDSLIGIGALKGAPCKIASIVDNSDGTHDITWLWKDDLGVNHTSVLTVSNGETPNIDVTAIAGGHRVTFTTNSPAQSETVDIMDGADGEDGISVTNAQVDPDTQHLIVTLSDGTEIDCGEVKGTTSLSELDEIDINTTTLSNGDVLVYNASSGKWENKELEIEAKLDDLQNVDIDSLTLEDGSILKYNATTHKWENGTIPNIESLGDIDDVNINNPANGQVLKYDETTHRWVNANGGGGGSYTAGNGINIDVNNVISTDEVIFVGTQAAWDALTPEEQNAYDLVNITDEEVLDLGVYLRKVKTMPNAEDAPSEFVMYIGANTADYTRGYIYRSVPSVVSGETVYNWVRQDVQPSPIPDLHVYQTKELETPLTINGVQETEVEDALGAIADTLENVGRYNVLDYGLKNDFYTDNVEALTDLIDSVEEGAVLYFPAGCYRFTDGIVITKRVAFIGDATTNMLHSSSSNNKPVTQFVYAGSANKTMFTYNGYFGFIVENITFYGGLNGDDSMSYRLIANTDEFTTLPYPYFKEVISLENVNCLDISSNGHPDDTIKNCVFYGFSGFGLKIQQHKIITNCAFKFCKVGIEMTYTDAIVTDCWFNNCGICVNTTTSSSANIQISNTWADGIGGHFVKCDNSTQCKLLINDVWVDMVDKSAICSEVGYLQNCQISGRFSRCGMMYAGLADADRTNAIKPLADVIYAPRIYNSEVDISIEKRNIGLGNNASGYCPSRAVSATGAFINNCYIHVYDTEYTNILGSNANYTEVISKDNHKVEFNIWSYDNSICTFRTNSPIGRASSPRLNAFAYDTTAHTLYIATAANDNTAWEIVTEPTQFSTMPTASATYLGKIVQYIGTTTSTYTHGYFYECVSDGAASPSYSWVNVITQKEILQGVEFTAQELSAMW